MAIARHRTSVQRTPAPGLVLVAIASVQVGADDNYRRAALRIDLTGLLQRERHFPIVAGRAVSVRLLHRLPGSSEGEASSVPRSRGRASRRRDGLYDPTFGAIRFTLHAAAKASVSAILNRPLEQSNLVGYPFNRTATVAPRVAARGWAAEHGSRAVGAGPSRERG